MSRPPHHPFPMTPINVDDVPATLLELFMKQAPDAGPLYGGIRLSRFTPAEKKELLALCKVRTGLDAVQYERHRALVAASGATTFVARFTRPKGGEAAKVKRMRLNLEDGITPPAALAFGWGPGDNSRMLAEGMLRDVCDGGSAPQPSQAKLLERVGKMTADVWVIPRSELLRMVAIDDLHRVTKRALGRGFTLDEILTEVRAAGLDLAAAPVTE